MTILAIETSTLACSVALGDEKNRFSRHLTVERAHAGEVLPMVDAVLSDSGRQLRAVDAVAFGAGPGSFTGIRIATAVAQGLGFATGRPLVGISSLAALAQGVLADNRAARVLVAQDARMDEIYAGGYALIDGCAEAEWPDRVLAPADLPAPGSWLLAGDAWERLGLAAERSSDEPSGRLYPDAVDMLPLARRALDRGQGIAAEFAEPNYHRDRVVRSL